MGGFMQSASGYSKMLDRDEHNDAIPFASAPRFDFTTTIANHSPGCAHTYTIVYTCICTHSIRVCL
jgi:hypothetical protein